MQDYHLMDKIIKRAQAEPFRLNRRGIWLIPLRSLREDSGDS